MSLLDVLSATITIVKCAYKLAVFIRDTESLKGELKETAKYMTMDLNIVGGLLEQLSRISHRIPVTEAGILLININSLNVIMTDAKHVLEEVTRNRTFFQNLFMKREDYQKQLNAIRQHLHQSCLLINGAIPNINKVSILRREFPDFRRMFRNVSEKTLSFYDFSIVRDRPQSVSTKNFEEFDKTTSSCYMKIGNEQFILSHQLRTWSALNPKAIVLEQRRKAFHKKYLPGGLNRSGSDDSISSTHSLPSHPTAPPVATNDKHEKLDFSEFFMSHDEICGMTFTKEFLYIATKYEITIISLQHQQIKAQYGVEGNGPNTFKHISYIYIPSDNEKNLYVVDRGQYAVHQYKISTDGLQFEYVRDYVVIADVIQQSNLVSCVIFNNNLFVSDDANNCLHIFTLHGDRQASYLCDNAITPFTPGSLCVQGKYLYVANCCLGSAGILVFNEVCQPIDWFRNDSLKEILTFDIDPYINELYILTTTNVSENDQMKGPMLVSMDLVIRPQRS